MNQKDIDKIFWLRLGNGTADFEDYRNDCIQIQQILENELNVKLSISECCQFWEWRSNQYDASWLNLHSDQKILSKDVINWFNNFYNIYNQEIEG